jgi:nucleotide-binding universal stress UspA family protein
MYNKILAPLDGSKLSECSLAHLKEITTGCHVGEVILLTVLEPIPQTTVEYGNQTQISAAYQQHEREQMKAKEMAEQYLTRVTENLKMQGVTAQNVVVLPEDHKSAAEVILNYAESNNIDLIIMSTHGRSGVTRWAFGSVADRVIRHSKVPVLTVVPAGCRLYNA